MTSPIDPRAIVRAARARVRTIPGWTTTPPATPEIPDPEPIEVPGRIVIGPSGDDIPDVLKSADGQFNIGAGLGLLWALLQSMEIRSVVGRVTLTAKPVTTPVWSAGQSVELPMTWDQVPPETPTGVLVSVEAGVAWMGKTTASVQDGSVTLTGCRIVVTNIGSSAVVPSASQPITYTAQALFLHTPPLEVL